METSVSSSRLIDQVPKVWRAALAPQLASAAFAALERFIAEERTRARVFPPHEQVFAALRPVTPAQVKAVIVGQDPYPTVGNANGLAFSVTPGVKVPASLRNLLAGLRIDLGLGDAKPMSGDLTAWAEQGVLLLNTVLTVREGVANSHRKQGWEPLTDAILREVNRQPGPTVFLALGVHAQKMADNLVDRSRHHVLPLPHPSPLNGNAFVEAARASRPFSRTNELLLAGGREPVRWEAVTPRDSAASAP